MEFVGLPEKQGGGAENRCREDETDWREVVGEGNKFDDQPGVDDAQEDRPCYIRVKNHRIESVLHWRIRLGRRRGEWCISTGGLDWDRGRASRWKEGGDLCGNEHATFHSVVADDASLLAVVVGGGVGGGVVVNDNVEL